jgi:hypothetical protein
MHKIVKVFLLILVTIILISAGIFCYFFVGTTKVSSKITWGVDFSQMQAENLKLDWKETYLALIKDLGAKNIKIHTQWDWVEGKKGEYYFKDIDWQLKTAKENNVKIIYVLGLKTGRWPECHAPIWTTDLSLQDQQEELFEYIKEVVLRYKDAPEIAYWQVENEPFFVFGKCPAWYYNDGNFLKKEVELVKSLDHARQVIVSDSGEGSMWFDVAKVGDIVGTTLYRDAWAHISDNSGFYMHYLFTPVFYHRKELLINTFFKKKVICIELQAEPWVSKPFYKVSLEDQFKTMNLQKFKDNVEFAKATGLDTFYFWGAEWWYWLKTTQSQPDIWNEAKTLFNKN